MTRGYFAIGVEGLSKEQNLGNLVRSAHAFGASWFFTVNPDIKMREILRTDTAESYKHMPFYVYEDVASLNLPHGCRLVGVEFLDDAPYLPSFRHPQMAAYVLGPEMGSLSDEMLARCDYTVKIPTGFCINMGTAGAIVMYDRLRTSGRFAERPVRPGGPVPGHDPLARKGRNGS